MTSLVQKVLELSDALSAAGVPRAFGGAIATGVPHRGPR